MKIALYDVDSTIPNLALMKLSAWHRNLGHEVFRYLPIMHSTYDQIYASKIFKFSDGSGITDDMIVGGTGVDMSTELPPEIYDMDPDYSIYGFKHSIGFASRGCRLKCKFCVVPKKEGSPVFNRQISRIWTQRDSDFVWLLDNDFFGSPSWKSSIEEIREYNLRVCFMQGLNIRIITEEQAHALKSVRFRNKAGTHSTVFFAWDRMKDEKWIRRGIQRLKDAGIKPWQMQFYVLIGFDSTEEEDLYRVMELKALGADPFVMAFDKTSVYQRTFARWVNHRAVFNTVSWPEYKFNPANQ